MARNTLKDPLEAAKLASDGRPADSRDPKVQAAEFLAQVRRELPEGVPASSPFAGAKVDDMLQAATRSNMIYGPFYSEEELRLVMHWGHVKLGSGPSAMTPIGAVQREPPPAVPLQPDPPPQIRRPRVREAPKLKPSSSNEWQVFNEKPMKVRIPGQAITLRPGAIIRRKDYEPGAQQVLDALIAQGVELEPYDPSED